MGHGGQYCTHLITRHAWSPPHSMSCLVPIFTACLAWYPSSQNVLPGTHLHTTCLPAWSCISTHLATCLFPFRSADFYDDADVGETSAVQQQGLLPTPNDPRLWVVAARPGHEREAVIQLQQKFISAMRRGMPLAIRSAICVDHLQGYVYVEADKEAHVSLVNCMTYMWM